MSEPAAVQAAATQKPGEAARQYANMIWQYRQAETVAAMIHVGDQLGLFKAMANAGALSAGDLAAKTGLHPRWLLEWMRLQAAAKVLAYRGDDRFELPAEANDVLANSAASGFAASSFTGGHPPQQLAGLMELFRTGIGKPAESEGPAAVTKSEERHRISAERSVIPRMIPALEGVAAKLEKAPWLPMSAAAMARSSLRWRRPTRARPSMRWTRAGLRSSMSRNGRPSAD